MINLRNITEENFEECIHLKLTEEQENYIASNIYSLAVAYAMTNGMNTPMLYAIYHNDKMVGFLKASFQPIDESDPDDDEVVYYISRFMIDKHYQRNGYGREAMKKLLELMKTFPYGRADCIILSCNHKNIPAYNLYTSLGFVDTGEFDEDGDAYLRLNL